MIQPVFKNIAVWGLAVLLAGCGKISAGPGPAIHVCVEYPGARPSVVEDAVCTPILQQLQGMENAKGITCVSSTGKGDVYVRCQPGISPSLLLNLAEKRVQLAAPMLPKLAKILSVKMVSESVIPSMLESCEVNYPEVDIHREKAAQLGISVSDVLQAIQKEAEAGEPRANTVQQLEQKKFQGTDGKEYPLADFASVRTIREPNLRIRLASPQGTPGGK